MSVHYKHNNGVVQTCNFEGTEVRFIQEEDGPHFFLTDLLAYSGRCSNISHDSFPEREYLTTQVVHTKSKNGYPQGRPVRLLSTPGALSFMERQSPSRVNSFKRVFLFDAAEEEKTMTINETFPAPEDDPLKAITQDKQELAGLDLSWLEGYTKQIQTPLVDQLKVKDELIDTLINRLFKGEDIVATLKPEFKVLRKASPKTERIKRKADSVPSAPSAVGSSADYVGIPHLDKLRGVVSVPHKAIVLPGPLGNSARPEQKGRPYYPRIEGYLTYKDLFALYGYRRFIGTYTGRKVSQQLAALCRRHNVRNYLVIDIYDPDHAANPAWCLVNAYPTELWDVVRPLLELGGSATVSK